MAEQNLKVFDRLRELATRQVRRIALPEAGTDARVLRAAGEAQAHGVAHVVLVGARDQITALAGSENVSLEKIEVRDTAGSDDQFAELYMERRRGRGDPTVDEARALAADPLYHAMLLLSRGDVDGVVSGASATTADVVRAAIRCVGTRSGIKTVSSFFLMVMPADSPMGEQLLLFADCAVVAEPTVEQLADIAITTADVGGKLFGLEPRIAMLSFSTRGSAQHELVTKVRDATQLVRSRRPDLPCDGEMQLDAAIVRDVGERKAPGSVVAGKANILIFPDLDSGNIGYKLTQRIAKAVAIGPVLQGLVRPVSDLSRGCSVQDVVDAIVLTAAQANLAE